MLDLPLAPTAFRDIIVIGGSSGSFEVIRDLLRTLPADLPASVLITTHLAPSVSLLTILKGSCPLPIKEATSGEPLRQRQVYVAVPDAHLLVHDHHVLIRRGPRENLARPAIDPLFRSAACAFTTRVIGILLSGSLNDGTAGLAAIKACGGVAVVQDPDDAQVPSMPQSALRAIDVDYCVPGKALSSTIGRLVKEAAGPAPAIPAELLLEVAVAAEQVGDMDINEKLGNRSPFTCPDCDGVLWQMNDDHMIRFRCHVGHAVTGEALLAQKGIAADAVLWRLLRVHEERAALARKLAQAAHRPGSREAYQLRAAGYEEDAAVVRGLLEKVSNNQSD